MGYSALRRARRVLGDRGQLLCRHFLSSIRGRGATAHRDWVEDRVKTVFADDGNHRGIGDITDRILVEILIGGGGLYWRCIGLGNYHPSRLGESPDDGTGAFAAEDNRLRLGSLIFWRWWE